MSLLLDQYRDGTIGDADASRLAEELRAGGDVLKDWEAETLVIHSLERITDEEFLRSFRERWRDDFAFAEPARPSRIGRIATMAASLLAFAAILWVAVSSTRQESDVQAIIDRFKSDDASQRDTAYENLISRWKEWSPEAMERIARGVQDADVEVASRCKDAVARIGLRRKLGAELVDKGEGIEKDLLGDPTYEIRSRMLRDLGRRWTEAKMGDEGLASLARYWVEKGWRLRNADMREAMGALRPLRPYAGLFAAHLDGTFEPDPAPADPRAEAERMAISHSSESIIQLLAGLDARTCAAKVAPFLRDGRASVRMSAADALGRFRAKAYAAEVRSLLKDPDPRARSAAAGALCRMGAAAEAITFLADALKNDPVCDAPGIVRALGEIGDARSEEFLQTALVNKDDRARRDAARALGRTGSGGSIKALLARTGDGTPYARIAAILALGELASRGGEADRDTVQRHLESPAADGDTGIAVRIALIRMGRSTLEHDRKTCEAMAGAGGSSRLELEKGLFRALAGRHEAKSWDRLNRPVVLSRSIEGPADLKAVLAEAGFRMEEPEEAPYWSQFDKGTSTGLADLMGRMQGVGSFHVVVEGDRVWRGSRDKVMDYWKARLAK